MATHSRTLAWRIPMDGGAWWATYSPWGPKESDMSERLHFHFMGENQPRLCINAAWSSVLYQLDLFHSLLFCRVLLTSHICYSVVTSVHHKL